MRILADWPRPQRTIVFDCASTLSAIEGIDELAGAHGLEIRGALARAIDCALANWADRCRC